MSATGSIVGIICTLPKNPIVLTNCPDQGRWEAYGEAIHIYVALVSTIIGVVLPSN